MCTFHIYIFQQYLTSKLTEILIFDKLKLHLSMIQYLFFLSSSLILFDKLFYSFPTSVQFTITHEDWPSPNEGATPWREPFSVFVGPELISFGCQQPARCPGMMPPSLPSPRSHMPT